LLGPIIFLSTIYYFYSSVTILTNLRTDRAGSAEILGRYKIGLSWAELRTGFLHAVEFLKSCKDICPHQISLKCKTVVLNINCFVKKVLKEKMVGE
jgi:hypothetical protein